MGWIAIAATVDNLIIAAHDDIVMLEQISAMDFGSIVKIYGLSDAELGHLRAGNLDFRIRFNNLRSTYLEPMTRPKEVVDLSLVYRRRAQMYAAMKGRFEHALNKHRSVLSHQMTVYHLKYIEACQILEGRDVVDGWVNDHAEEHGMTRLESASLIVAKHNDMVQHLRKIERLRLRHFHRLKMAKTEEDFNLLSAEMDRDFFINMLM